MNKIPILICVKNISKRCHNKNKILLPYAFIWLRKNKLLDNVVIISNSENMLTYAKEVGFKNTFFDKNEDNELLSCLNYINENDNDMFFLYPITQPMKDITLFENCINELKSDIDFVTTKVKVKKRDIFYINENDEFISYSKERKGSLCDDVFMIDGTLYLIKKSFLNKNKTNELFWKGKFKTILNNNISIDIDDEYQLNNFLNIII